MKRRKVMRNELRKKLGRNKGMSEAWKYWKMSYLQAEKKV
jgi:hypothetical protein